MQEVAVTDHAVARYRERVKPGLGFDAAEAELLRVLPFGVFSAEGPRWRTAVVQNIVAWVLLGDGIAFPLARDHDGTLAAVTCLTRGGSSEDALRLRRERKAARRAARRLNVDGVRGSRRRRHDEVAA